MENQGFEESNNEPKFNRRSRFKRTISVYPGMMIVPEKVIEEVPSDNVKSNNCKRVSVYWKKGSDSLPNIEQSSSDNFEYMVLGPSPPAESAPNMFDSFDDPPIEYSVQVSSDTIKQALIEQSRQASIRSSLFDDIKSATFTPETVLKTLNDSLKIEKNLCMLWAAYNRRWDLLESFLSIGADVHFCDAGGLSVLHMSSFVGCKHSVVFLISKGANVNLLTKCFTPLHCAAFGNQPDIVKLLIDNGAIVSLTTKKTTCEETILHCAVRANAVECLQIFIANGVNVNDVQPSGMNPIHLAADLGMVDCLEVLLKCKDANVNLKTKVQDKETTALHLATDEGSIECVDILLNHGADVNLKNHRGFTALHLAARCSNLECVESLLKNGRANPNAEDDDKRTPLHTAIGKSDAAFDIIETLISWGANVNCKDEFGFTPLHLAAIDGLSNCVETLIYHGADVTTKTKEGNSALNAITRKTPGSKAMIFQKLDDAISLHRIHGPANREVEMELDFRNILQHHPREISYLNTFVDEGQKEILSHPLCSAFLHIKWNKIRKYYIARLIFCFFYVGFLTLYALTKAQSLCLLKDCAQNCDDVRYCSSVNDDADNDYIPLIRYCSNDTIKNNLNDDSIDKIRSCNNASFIYDEVKNLTVTIRSCSDYYVVDYTNFTDIINSCNNNSIIYDADKNSTCNCIKFIPKFNQETQWFILCIITIFEILRKLYGIAGYSTIRQYLSQLENVLEWFVTVCIVLISCVIFDHNNYWQNNLSAFAVLAGWVNLMLMVGQLPVFGSYVAMYITVLKEFIKLILAYLCILIGFTMSFCILYPEQDVYKSTVTGFIATLVMMVGELESDLFKGDQSPGALIVFTLFLMFMTITLMNLLVGIAVQDIQGLTKTAGLSKLVRQTKLICYMESALLNRYLPNFLLKIFVRSALVSPQAYRVVLSVKPLNPSEKRLPVDIMKDAYEIAKSRKNIGNKVVSRLSTSNSFKRFNAYNLQNNSEFSSDNGARSLKLKIDEANDKIEALSLEIKELTNIISKLVPNYKFQNLDTISND